MNEFLTAYLRALHAMRGGRLSASDAMNHVVDLVSRAQGAMTALGRLTAFGRRAASDGIRNGTSGREHA